MKDRSRTSAGSGEQDTEAQSANGIADGRGNRLRLFRRGFVGVLGAFSAGLATDSTIAATLTHSTTDTTNSLDSDVVQQRVENEYDARVAYSETQLLDNSDTSAHASNDRVSEDAVVAKFGKSLDHDDDTGLPTAEAYESLVEACETGGGYGNIQQADLSPADDDIDTSDLVDEELNPRPLVQPETAWTYMTEGASTAQLRIAVPPPFDDPETGAEMVELYWRALTRDVDFRDYDNSELVAAAAAELNSLDAYQGPGVDDGVTPGNVFRGVTPGAEVGPYVSQFLWKDRNLGRGPEDQRIQPQVIDETASIDPDGTVGPPTDYATTVEDWLKIQKGVAPATDDSLPGNAYSQERRYIITGRDMCERVHDDPPYRQVQKAAQVLIFTMNAPLDDGIPYTLKPFEKPSPSRRDVDNFTAQTTLPFNDFGPLYIEKKVLEAAEHGQKAAWHKKWNVHRRLRPEEYAGRVQAVLTDSSGDGPTGNNGNGPTGNNGNGPTGNNGRSDGGLETVEGGYPVPENLLDSHALELASENYGSYLLPQAYAEGSPTHPSYPAGHSVVAGAGVTVLKALFDGDYVFPPDQKVVPTRDGTALETAGEVSGNPMDIEDTLTVRGELNKLASNMALGRNRAGIHYRSDGIEGLRLGEAAAIRFLEDQLTLSQRVEDPDDGQVALGLETFDGDSVTVTPTV